MKSCPIKLVFWLFLPCDSVAYAYMLLHHAAKTSKCQKCHGVILEYGYSRDVLFLEKVNLSHCAKVQEMQGIAMRKNV